MPTRLLIACLIAPSVTTHAWAQDDSPEPPEVSEQDRAREEPEASEGERPPLGWLSDPDKKPDTLLEALLSGKIHVDNTLRLELADTTNRRASTALTNRIRLGYETKSFAGFSGFVEMENVATPTSDEYFVPPTSDGPPDRTVIADPPGTELNQAYGRFSTDSIGSSTVSLDLKAGRQRIKLDNDRFIGNVGWRQFEQTYDAVSVRSDLGIDGFSAFYAYLWRVQRIFGPDGPNPDSDSHLINLSYRFAPELKLTGFAYLLDLRSEDPINSSDSTGVRLSGELWKDEDDIDDRFADYAITYAHQSDAGSNPVDYSADFFSAQLKLVQRRLGHVLMGYQFLGSDGGNFAFRFPLGTNHAFQGFADNFLTTPAVGLQDLYIGLGVDLPWGIQGSVIYHEYWSDQGGSDLGEELDLVAEKQLTPIWSVLAKAAYYDGDSGQPDTTRFWLQTTLKF